MGLWLRNWRPVTRACQQNDGNHVCFVCPVVVDCRRSGRLTSLRVLAQVVGPPHIISLRELRKVSDFVLLPLFHVVQNTINVLHFANSMEHRPPSLFYFFLDNHIPSLFADAVKFSFSVYG
jgi:hypothetical protein